ncbi:MAG: L,D-transpeptidase family protein, partial [Noviherbaspirillum sp.]
MKRPAGCGWRRVLRLLAGLGVALAFGMGPGTAAGVQPARADGKPDPDALLDEVLHDLAGERLHAALGKADSLVRLYPNFRLGHLVRGDLLRMQSGVVDRLGAVPGAAGRELEQLRAEAAARVAALRARPGSALVPRPVLQLRDDQKRVLVVDTRRSRLYVYGNRGGNRGENPGGELELLDDYYISHGKSGVDKRHEGDSKTPLGVYYITGRLEGEKLPDFYGPLALPISYPNEWDRLHGRGGSGIWLHGTPPDSYSRPPLASEGCVVLSNRDLDRLAASVEVGKTPVVISDGVEFISRADAAAQRALARSLVDRWLGDFTSEDGRLLRAHYSPRFRSARGDRIDAWLKRPRARAGTGMRDLSLFFYPGREQTIVATSTLQAPRGDSQRPGRRRQYWEK